MGQVAAIGEAVRIQGLGLAGVLVLPGDEPHDVRDSWAGLADDITVVVLTPRAAELLGADRLGRLTVVMPP